MLPNLFYLVGNDGASESIRTFHISTRSPGNRFLGDAIKNLFTRRSTVVSHVA
jgi:hypothetical protein